MRIAMEDLVFIDDGTRTLKLRILETEAEGENRRRRVWLKVGERGFPLL